MTRWSGVTEAAAGRGNTRPGRELTSPVVVVVVVGGRGGSSRRLPSALKVTKQLPSSPGNLEDHQLFDLRMIKRTMETRTINEMENFCQQTRLTCP